jgi:hypothetical protein
MRKEKKEVRRVGGLGVRTPCLRVLVKGYSGSASECVTFSTGSYELLNQMELLPFALRLPDSSASLVCDGKES